MGQRLDRRDQRGAAMVEAAIVLPVMLIIVIGILEFGLLFGNYSTAVSSTRSGARVGAALYSQALTGAQETAQQTAAIGEIVAATEADLKAMNNATPIGMAIYKVNPSASDGSPAGGFPGPGLVGGCSSNCIKFTWNGNKMVRQSAAQQWPMPQRCALANVDSIGVYVEVEHKFITGMFGNRKSLVGHTVMRLEPVPSQSC